MSYIKSSPRQCLGRVLTWRSLVVFITYISRKTGMSPYDIPVFFMI